VQKESTDIEFLQQKYWVTDIDAFQSTKHVNKGAVLRNKRLLDYLFPGNQQPLQKMSQLCDAPSTTVPLTDVTFIAPHCYSSKLDLLKAFNLQIVAGVSMEASVPANALSDCKVTVS